MRVGYGKFVQSEARLGIAVIFMVLIIIVLVLIVGVGVYYVAVGSSSSTSFSSQSSTQRSTSGPTSASSTGSASHSTTTPSTGRSSTGSSGISTYAGTFSFSLPIGPSGERVLSNYTVQTYTSVQVASGSFTFSIAASNRSGSGSGHGTLVVTTSGFCSGKTTVPYTFLIPDATTLLGNLTIFIGTPKPANFTVPLTCTGPMTGVNTSTNNPASFLSVYPNEISAATTPVTVTQHLAGNITYYYNITPTN